MSFSSTKQRSSHSRSSRSKPSGASTSFSENLIPSSSSSSSSFSSFRNKKPLSSNSSSSSSSSSSITTTGGFGSNFSFGSKVQSLPVFDDDRPKNMKGELFRRGMLEKLESRAVIDELCLENWPENVGTAVAELIQDYAFGTDEEEPGEEEEEDEEEEDGEGEIILSSSDDDDDDEYEEENDQVEQDDDDDDRTGLDLGE